MYHIIYPNKDSYVYEVNLNDDPNELYDSSDDNMVERDHLDITEWCMNLDAIEIIDDMMFNYLED